MHPEDLRIERLTLAHEAAWDAYVAAHPHATVFHLTGWRRILADVFGHEELYLLARIAGRIVGVLPLFCCRSATGSTRLISLPHLTYAGPIADGPVVEAALHGSARVLADRAGASVIELRNRYRTSLPLESGVAALTFEKALPRTVEAVMAELPQKARNKVHQAARRHALLGSVEAQPAIFYELLATSYQRLGTPVYPRHFFDAILREFPHSAWIYIVRQRTRPVAAAFCLTFRDVLMPVWTGEAVDARGLRPSNFLFTRLMELGVTLGARRFDLGRTLAANEGGIAFKKNQGFAPEPLAYQVDHLRRRTVPPLDPYGGLGLRIRHAWSRLPPSVAGWLGPNIVRYLP